MRDSLISPVMAGVGAGIGLIVLFILGNPVDLPNPHIVNSAVPTRTVISQSEAEVAARDHLDKIAQSNGEQAGVYRGGMLGSAKLIYVDTDGTNYVVDKPGGKIGERLLYPIDGSKDRLYVWEITLNYGNSTKLEYVYAVDGYDGEAWMIAVID